MNTLSEENSAIIRDAWCLRAKYRKASGQRIPNALMAPHQTNRGGVYPTPDRVVHLACEILSDKFVPEEANHLAVCIEELPAAEQMKAMPANWVGEKKVDGSYMSIECYNRTKTAAVAAFDKLWANNTGMLYGTLSHTHLLLVLLSIRNGAAWPLEKLGAEFQDLAKYKDGKDGPWKWSAVADQDADLKECVELGLTWEVLSFQLYLDNPAGASMISNALNKQNGIGMTSSEITALNVVCGAALSSTESDTSSSVCYESVRLKVRRQLGHFADEAAFPDFLDLALGLGIRSGGWLKTFVAFAEKYVDSKKRQLRLEAYGLVNKMPLMCPRTKVAVLMRAYRKEPRRTWCPEPEALWAKLDTAEAHSIEQMLAYLWQTCKPIRQKWGEADSWRFFAEVGINVAEGFAEWVQKEKKGKRVMLHAALIKAAGPFVDELRSRMGDAESLPAPSESWIKFSAVAEKGTGGQGQEQQTTKNDDALRPKIIEYDASGNPVGKQDTRDGSKKPTCATVVALPWKEWLGTSMALDLDRDACFQAAIQMLLTAYHRSSAARGHPVDVMARVDTKKKSVVAAEDLNENVLKLLPCAPKNGKAVRTNTHPERAAVRVKQRSPVLETEWTTFYISPEWKAPDVAEKRECEDTEEGASETGEADAEAQEANRAAVAAFKRWTFTGEESMHPYWAIERMTEEEITKRNSDDTQDAVQINMGVTTLACHAIAVCAWSNLTVDVEFEALTNTKPIKKGECLVREAQKKVPQNKRPLNWKDDQKAKSQKAEGKPAAKKTAAKHGAKPDKTTIL